MSEIQPIENLFLVILAHINNMDIFETRQRKVLQNVTS